MREDIDILEAGNIISQLEKAVKKPVGLVVLNDLYKKSPQFAFNIVKSSKLLFAGVKMKMLPLKGTHTSFTLV